jgi:plastocyanin
MNNLNWTLPAMTDLVGKGVRVYDTEFAKCILRIRYNISTDDYDPWNTNSTYNTQTGGTSPITGNPTVNIGADLAGLKLAINTNQFGRTFEDRTHIFYIRSRAGTALANKKVWNLNVRGKRGNIVQTYPSLEYDFVPNRLHVALGDAIHLQWTGSNTHDNNPDSDNAGDGQGGDAGEGTGGTDRSNFVQINKLDETFPIPLDRFPENIFKNVACSQLDGTTIGVTGAGVSTNVDCALWLATSGYFRTATDVTGAAAGGDGLNPTLDNAPPSLIGGVVLHSWTKPATYHYIASRNNNFSNRTQKGTIIVDPASP